MRDGLPRVGSIILAHMRVALIATLFALPAVSCVGSVDGGSDNSGAISAEPDMSRRTIPLDSLPEIELNIGTARVNALVASTSAQRAEGLMFVGEGVLAEDQGMLFVFPTEQLLAFWMRNTYIALDIAYADADGLITTIHQMPPLTDRRFLSAGDAQFALEMPAGSFERLGIEIGQQIGIPSE